MFNCVTIVCFTSTYRYSLLYDPHYISSRVFTDNAAPRLTDGWLLTSVAANCTCQPDIIDPRTMKRMEWKEIDGNRRPTCGTYEIVDPSETETLNHPLRTIQAGFNDSGGWEFISRSEWSRLISDKLYVDTVWVRNVLQWAARARSGWNFDILAGGCI